MERAGQAFSRNTATSTGEDFVLRELMRGYMRGDAGAFEELYDRIEPELRAYVASTCGPPLRDDVLQEVFLQIHRSRHTYSPSRPLRPWVYAIARYVSKMALRTLARRRRRLEDYRDAQEQKSTPAAPTRTLENGDALQRALSTLKTSQREPLLLHHVLGMSYEEIATILGIRPSTARVRAHRGMRQLRRRFDITLEEHTP